MTQLQHQRILVTGARLHTNVRASLVLNFEELGENSQTAPLITPSILLGTENAKDGLFEFRMDKFPYLAFATLRIDIGFLFESFNVEENPYWIRRGESFGRVGDVLLSALERTLEPIIKVCFSVTSPSKNRICVQSGMRFNGSALTLTHLEPYEDESRVLSPLFELM